MRTLIIGASGQVGRLIFHQLYKTNKTVHGTYLSKQEGSKKYCHKLDVSKYNDVKRLFEEVAPEIVYLAGAATNVDWCESNSKESYNINVIGTKNVVDLLPDNATLVFFSTDYIFDGAEGLYNEKAAPNPICQYGEQKLIAEHYILSQGKQAYILRTHGVFGHDIQGKNFPMRLVSNLLANIVIKLPSDEYGTPTYNEDLVNFAVNGIDSCSPGVYHVAGPDNLCRYKFGLELARLHKQDASLIFPTYSSAISRPARRPLNGGLTTIHKNLIKTRSFYEIYGDKSNLHYGI